MAVHGTEDQKYKFHHYRSLGACAFDTLLVRQKHSRSVFTDELESSNSCDPPQMASSTFTAWLLPSLTVQTPLSLCK